LAGVICCDDGVAKFLDLVLTAAPPEK
jgi:hypothetical protein